MRGVTRERIPLIRDASKSTVVQPMAEYIRQQIETWIITTTAADFTC